MLNKQHRLTKEKDIDRVHRKGRSFFTKYFIVKYNPNDLKKNRFTVVVSTKISKNATRRNRIKRIIREELRLQNLKMNQGFDFVINVTKSALTPDQKIIESKLLKDSVVFALKKLGLL